MTDQYSIKHMRNKHQFQITDQPLTSLLPKSYRNTSQVSDLLHQNTDHTKSYNYQLKKYHNPITQQSHSLQIPKIYNQDNFQKDKLNKISKQHQNWFQINKKFSKPYSECTKYIDNLSQHKALIRRGPFDIPVHKQNLLSKQTTEEVQTVKQQIQSSSRQYSVDNNFSRIKSISSSINQAADLNYKSIFRTKKDIIFKSLNNLKSYDMDIQNKQHTSKSINFFDRSIKNHANNYKKLMKKQRDLQQDKIVLKNSVNKLVAIDIINQKLTKDSFINKNNLKKIHQKFKKKPEIIVKTQQ